MDSEQTQRPQVEPVGVKTTKDLLWGRAIYLADQIQAPLVEYQNQLFSEVEGLKRQKLGVSKSKLEEAELSYWRVAEKTQALGEEINKITKAISDFEGGSLSEEELRKLLPQEEPGNEKLSKRKQAILREKENLKKRGIDPREIAYEMHTVNFGANSYRFTTGRHQKRVRGNMNSYTAEGEFFHKTTDTHGGKVSSGKKPTSYTTRAGKRIRKS